MQQIEQALSQLSDLVWGLPLLILLVGTHVLYAEALLSVKFRVTTPSGQMAAGPIYVLERGMNCRCAMTWLVGVNSGEWTKGLNGASLSKANSSAE